MTPEKCMGTLNVLLEGDDGDLAMALTGFARDGSSDFNMPGPSDVEFLTQIGQNHREIILVLIAAQGTDVLEEGAHQLGAGYRTRLFEPSFLVQLIRDSIRDKETAGTAENGSRIMHKLGEPAGSSFLPHGGVGLLYFRS